MRGRASPVPSPFRILALEPRLMFDGAAVSDAAEAAAKVALPAAVTVRDVDPAKDGGRKEVAFVDVSVHNYKTLEAGIRDGVAIVEIGGGADGLAQMAAWAERNGGYDAIHIFSHGSEGSLSLGNATVTTAQMGDDTVKAELSSIGKALTADGDMLLYGCSVASGEGGQAFLAALSAATGADVAASTDVTGGAAAGGDWVLEAHSGDVAATALAPTGFADRLAVYTFNFESTNTISGNGTAVVTLRETSSNVRLQITANQGTFKTGSDVFNGYSTTFSGSWLLNEAGSATFITITADLNNDGVYGDAFSLDSFKLADPSFNGGEYSIKNGDGYTEKIMVNSMIESYVTFGPTALNKFNNITSLKIYFSSAATGVALDDIKIGPPVLPGPTVSAIDRVSAQTVPTASTSVSYTVTFSEAVSGVDATDFTLTTSGNAAGTIGTPTTSDGGITWTVPVTGISGDGTLRLDLNGSGTGIKNGSNSDITGGFSTGQSYTLDHTAPGAPTISISSDTGAPSDGVTKTASQTVAVTAEGGATLDVDYGDGSSHGTATTNTHTYADGKYTISVTATDAAGNVSSAGTKVIVVDRTAPTDITPSVTRLATTSATNGATFCALTATDATSISGFTDAWTYTLGGTDAGKFSIVGGNLVINNTGGLTAGSYSVDVTATDTAGNTFTKTLTLTVASGPSTTVSAASLSADTGSSNTDWITKTAGQTINGTLSAALVAGEWVEVSFDNGANWQTVTDVTGSTFRFDHVLTGTDTFKARVTDSIGSSTAFSHTYALDTSAVAPSTPDLIAASDSGISDTDNKTANTTPTFTGTAEKGATVTLYDTDGTTVLGTATADAGTGIWTITSSALSAGEHQVKAQTVDVAGNVSTLSAELKVVIDTTAPAAPSAPDLIASSDSGTSDTDNKTTNITPTFTGTAEIGATVTLYDSDGTTMLGSAVADAGGIWSITTSALGLGTHTVTAKATDAAGNASVASGSLSVDIVAAPAAPAVTSVTTDGGVFGTGHKTNDTTLSIGGTAPANASVLVYKGGVQIGTATASAGGSWNFDYTGTTLADGVHDFTAVARVAGQDSAASAALRVTVDTVAPSTPVVTGIGSDTGSSASDGITSDRTLVISGTTEAGSTVEVFKNGVSIGTAVVTGTTWSFDYSGTSLADGTYVFTAKATDAAGNLSALSSGFTAKVTPNANAPAASGAVLTPPKGAEGGTYAYTLPAGSFTDADAGDTLTYSASGLPAGLTIDATTGAIGGTPSKGGVYTVAVTATDSAGLTATKVMTITITADNALLQPAANAQKADQAANPAGPATGNDTGGSAPLVTAVREPAVSDKPAGMETVVRTVTLAPPNSAAAGFSLNSGIVNSGAITPALGDIRAMGGGTFQVALAGRAPGGGDALMVNIRVPDASFDAGSRISVTVPGDAFAHTRADAMVTLTATRGDGAALPGWMSFDPRTGTFEGTPPPNFRGEVVVKVIARDSDGRQVVQTFKIVVGKGKANAAPAGRASLSDQLREMGHDGRLARQSALFALRGARSA